MTVMLRFDLRRGRSIAELQFHTPPGVPLTRAGAGGYYATTAHGPDLFQNARTALRTMLDHLEDEYGLARPQALCLAGAAVDLKISEIVNEPHWLVSAYLPLGIFG
jgi:acetamidase/formamidase